MWKKLSTPDSEHRPESAVEHIAILARKIIQPIAICVISKNGVLCVCLFRFLLVLQLSWIFECFGISMNIGNFELDFFFFFYQFIQAKWVLVFY